MSKFKSLSRISNLCVLCCAERRGEERTGVRAESEDERRGQQESGESLESSTLLLPGPGMLEATSFIYKHKNQHISPKRSFPRLRRLRNSHLK